MPCSLRISCRASSVRARIRGRSSGLLTFSPRGARSRRRNSACRRAESEPSWDGELSYGIHRGECRRIRIGSKKGASRGGVRSIGRVRNRAKGARVTISVVATATTRKLFALYGDLVRPNRLACRIIKLFASTAGSNLISGEGAKTQRGTPSEEARGWSARCKCAAARSQRCREEPRLIRKAFEPLGSPRSRSESRWEPQLGTEETNLFTSSRSSRDEVELLGEIDIKRSFVLLA